MGKVSDRHDTVLRSQRGCGGAGSRGSPWFPLRFNQLLGVRWRGRLLGPGRAVAELRTPWPWCVYDVFWLLSFGLYVPVPAPLAPPFLRGLRPGKVFSGAPSSLISSEDFPGLALRVDGPARAQLRKLRQQPKNNGGEGSWPVTIDRPTPHVSAKAKT